MSPGLGFTPTALMLRFAISQMDVSSRQGYLVAMVATDERSVAAGITAVAHTIRGGSAECNGYTTHQSLFLFTFLLGRRAQVILRRFCYISDSAIADCRGKLS